MDQQGRRAGPGRAGVLDRRADPRRLAGLRHRDHAGHHLRDPGRARRAAQASRRETRCGGWSVARRGRGGLLRRRPVAGRRHPHHLLTLAPDGRGRGHAVRRVHPADGARRVLRRRDQDGVLRLPRSRGVRVRRADADGDRRAAGAGRRDHRAGRERGQVRPQVPDQGRQPHPADGPAARRAGGRVAGHRAASARPRATSPPCTRAATSGRAASRSTTSTTGRRACGTACTSRTASAMPSTTGTPRSSSWRRIPLRSCRLG